MNPSDDALKAACETLSKEVVKGVWARAIQKAKRPETFHTASAELIEKEKQLRAAIDEACGYWAESRLFPSMRPDLAELVWLRFPVCAGLLRLLHESGFVLPGKSESEILKWVLVDFWRIYGTALLTGMPAGF